MVYNKRDVISGAIVAATGLFFAVTALKTLPVGTTFRMGPGYFPVSVGLLVAVLGLAIVIGALRQDGQEALAPIRLRPIVMIPAAVFSFLLTVRGAGLIPAVFLVVVVSRAADPESRPLGTLVLAASMCALCAAIFLYALKLPIPMFGAWLRGG